MLFRYSYAAKVCAKNKSLCYCYVITVLTKNPIIIKPILQDLYISLYTMKKSLILSTCSYITRDSTFKLLREEL